MNEYVSYSIKLRPCKEVGDHIHVDFTIKNTSDNDLMILKWNTPLEGIKSDLFKILKGKYHVRYDGILIKRAAPTEDDYVKLKSGKSITSSVEITENYGINREGNYHIELRSVGLNYIVIPKGSKQKVKISEASNHFHLQTPKLVFSLQKGKGQPRQTLGRIYRKMATGKASIARKDLKAAAKMKKMAKATSPKAPVFEGGTSSQKRTVTTAHEKAFLKVQSCEDQLNNNGSGNSLYKTWFGNYAQSRYSTVSGNYSKVQQAMQNDTITYNLTGQGCGSGVYAYTYKGTRKVWLCEAFWTAPTSGVDTKFGTIIHELSHAVALTDDIVYGQAGAKSLAKSDPSRAIKNADSYEYFSENV